MLKKLSTLLLCLVIWNCTAYAESSPRDDILEAMEVCSWFVMNPLDVDKTYPAPDGGDYLLLDEEFRQTSLMRERLNQYFSPEISESLWGWGMYRDIDGLLFGTPIEENALARPIDPMISEVDYELTSQTGEKIIYTVTVHYLTDSEQDDSETLEYVKEYIGGQWVFTVFPFFW